MSPRHAQPCRQSGPGTRGTVAAYLLAALIAGCPAWASAADLSPRVWQALILCKKHFADPDSLQQAFLAAGWQRENDAATPIIIFTAEDQRVIAAFTRSDAPAAACTTGAKGLSAAAVASLADQFARKSGGFAAHPDEPQTWVWTTARKPTWFGATERKRNFAIFRAYAIALMER